MPADMPVDVQKALINTPPAIYAQADPPTCQYLSREQVNLAFNRLRNSLPSTSFVEASASEICGMVRVTMASGKVAYTDVTGRYLLLAFAFDTHKGSPADTSQALEEQIQSRETYKQLPGVLPGIELSE